MFVSSVSFGQDAKKEIEKAMDAFDNALMLKDSNALKALVHDTIHYAHSNGWVQTKKELIGDFYNGKIEYESIAVEQPVTITEKSGRYYANFKAAIKGIVESKPFEVYLNVVQVWTKENGNWVLIQRRSNPSP
jgi:hypothetical protein